MESDFSVFSLDEERNTVIHVSGFTSYTAVQVGVASATISLALFHSQAKNDKEKKEII